MNAKRYSVATIVLNTVLVALAGSLCLAWQPQRSANDPGRKARTGSSGKFGPVIESVLHAAVASTQRPAQILDLETGRVPLQPSFGYFNSRPDAVIGWIRTNGLDISCTVWSSGAACVTYGMTTVAVEGKCWEETTEAELLGNPALAPVRQAPRRMLVVGNNRPDTYLFRTGEGTLGMLRIVGLSPHGDGVKIRYKLINPAKAQSAAL